jgi:hypothetical protein
MDVGLAVGQTVTSFLETVGIFGDGCPDLFVAAKHCCGQRHTDGDDTYAP